MNIGKTLFAQVMDFLPWKTFHRIVAQQDGDRYVKLMTCAAGNTYAAIGNDRTRRLFFGFFSHYNRQVAGTMQHALDTHHALENAKENHITIQGGHAETGCHIVTRNIAKRSAADSLALVNQFADKAPGIGRAVFGYVIADVEQVLP